MVTLGRSLDDHHSFEPIQAIRVHLDKGGVCKGLGNDNALQRRDKYQGFVNKVKGIKRSSYGQAGFPLLQRRVLLHPA